MAFDEAFWDERYSAFDLAYGDQPNDFLKGQKTALPKGTCLCLAEGQGRNAVWLAQQGLEVMAVDQSSVGLARAQKLASEKAVHIGTQAADLADYDMGVRKWDMIVSIFGHLPPELRRDVHARVVTALKPGGVFLLEAYTPKQLEMDGVGGPPNAELLMSEKDLLNELAGLDFMVACETEREIHESEMHHGRSAVVQILARKPEGE